MTLPPSLSIWLFVDPREWLRQVYAFKKTEGKYSFARMSEEFNLGDRAFIQQILAGKRPFPDDLGDKIAHSWGLNPQEAKHLHTMIAYVDSNHLEDKEKAWKVLQKHLRHRYSEQQDMEPSIWLLEHWATITIRELICSFQISDPKEIGRHIAPDLPVPEIRRIKEKLIETEAIKQNDDGSWFAATDYLDIPAFDWKSEVIRRHQGQMLEIGKEMLFKTSRDERYMRTATITIDDESFAQIQSVLDRALEDIVKISMQAEKPDAVYQINLNAFSLTKKP
jgi:uncharacterized protein (TIGR02147 family)